MPTSPTYSPPKAPLTIPPPITTGSGNVLPGEIYRREVNTNAITVSVGANINVYEVKGKLRLVSLWFDVLAVGVSAYASVQLLIDRRTNALFGDYTTDLLRGIYGNAYDVASSTFQASITGYNVYASTDSGSNVTYIKVGVTDKSIRCNTQFDLIFGVPKTGAEVTVSFGIVTEAID